MIYCKVDKEKWENGYYYDMKLTEAFPNLKPDYIYKCYALTSVETENSLWRVDDDLGESSYVPSEFMIPLDVLRDKLINELI